MDYEEYIDPQGRTYFLKTDQIVERMDAVQYFDVKRDNATLPEEERSHTIEDETTYTPAIKLSRTQRTIWGLNQSQTLEVLEKIGLVQIKLELEKGTDMTNYSYIISTDTVPANMTPTELETYLTNELETLISQRQTP